MTMVIPQDGSWIQRNRSDMLGDLQGTFNCDFTKVLGKTRVTRTLQTTTQTTNTDLTGYPVGFRLFNNGTSTKLYTVAGSKVHTGSANAFGTFSVDASTGTPTTCSSSASDIETFNGALYVTTYDGAGDKLYKNSSGTWTANGTSLGSTSGTHMLTTYANRLYISRGNNSIYSMDTSDVIATSSTYTISLDVSQYVTFMRAASNRIWIGTVVQSGKGYVYEWDGSTTQPQLFHRLESQGALSCVIKDDIPWIVDTNGRLMQYSNGTFIEVARLPIDDKLLAVATNNLNTRFIHPNGMTVVNGRINILVNNLLDNTTYAPTTEFCPAGIWEYEDVVYSQYTGTSQGAGLYHKYGLSYKSANSVDVTDYGQFNLSGVGALSEVKLNAPSSNATGNLIAGATVYKNASSTDVGIFTNDTYEVTSGQYPNTMGAGYIVTTKQYAQSPTGVPSVQNTWQTVYTMYRKFLTLATKIKVKYRVLDSDPIYASITWTSATTFTTNTNLIGYEGYEVEVLQGAGGGLSSHITKIDQYTVGATTTYTITVNETYPTTSGTAKIRVQNWKNISDVSQSGATYEQSSMGDLSNWVQFKICMIFSQKDELEKLIIQNDSTLPASH